MPTKIDYLRIIGAEEFRHREPDADVMCTPLGGAVLVRRGSATAEALKAWSTSSINGNACLQPELLQTVHPGLKAELMWSVHMHAEAQAMLEASKRSRDYALALVGVQHYGEWRAAELREFQALARSIAALAECLSVLEELGIGTAR